MLDLWFVGSFFTLSTLHGARKISFRYFTGTSELELKLNIEMKLKVLFSIELYH